jgi:hypothetical protein
MVMVNHADVNLFKVLRALNHVITSEELTEFFWKIAGEDFKEAVNDLAITLDTHLTYARHVMVANEILRLLSANSAIHYNQNKQLAVAFGNWIEDNWELVSSNPNLVPLLFDTTFNNQLSYSGEFSFGTEIYDDDEATEVAD